LSGAAALFLDFDGTLAPIAARPQDVLVPAWVNPTLQALAQRLNGALAIVSGRPIAQLDGFLDPLRLVTAGAHGAEWRDGSGSVHRLVATPPANVVAAADQLAARHTGLLLEPKPSGLSLHYRARPELEAECRDTLFAALAAAAGAAADWEWMQGQFVLELKQRAVSKGSAVQALMRQPVFVGREPVFVGDDRTDEDGIAAVQAAGGYGVRVGDGPSKARYRLADPASVGAWLRSAVQPGATSQETFPA
jgi:trehalose 6-phosphate phosphatase